MNNIHMSVVTVGSNSYIVYLKAEYDDGDIKCFSVLAFEQVIKDCRGQRFMHELLDQSPKTP